MARTALNYLRLLQSLLPRGKAWNREDGSTLSEFLQGTADEFVRIDGRADDLLIERDTRKTTELLVDHELDFGIPDECSQLASTIQERRNVIHYKLLLTGRQDKQYYIDLAAALGYAITITEYAPDTFKWDVDAWSGAAWIFFRSGQSVSGDPITYAPGKTLLECVMNKYKPAHTTVSVIMVGADFDRSFGPGFLSLPSTDIDYLEGAFGKSFGVEFDRRVGGSFEWGTFGGGFDKPM